MVLFSLSLVDQSVLYVYVCLSNGFGVCVSPKKSSQLREVRDGTA